MAGTDFNFSECSDKQLHSWLRHFWLVLTEVLLVLEHRDQIVQDRNPSMTQTVGLLVDLQAQVLDVLEARDDSDCR